MPPVQPPVDGLSWLALADQVLPVGIAHDWAVLPGCGAVVVFSGVTRDHAVDAAGELREGVDELAYEAYAEQVVPRFEAIVGELRQRWPRTGRVALLHRVGTVALGESSVVVVVSAPHRDEAFLAARFAIDAIKSSAPIWKRESWEGGEGWGTGAHDVVEPGDVATADLPADALAKDV
jgi:molybdopterin synthase catalytic subunit